MALPVNCFHMTKKRKKSLSEIAKGVPSNFQFGLVVAIAIFWTEFIKDVITYFTNSLENPGSVILVSFLTAFIFTVFALLVLRFYVPIRELFKKIKF